MSKKTMVAIAMSGGVDSSVAAALLVEQGYEVIGMMLRLWSEPDGELSNRCCTPDSMALARRVASILSIPFYVVDAREFFFTTVVDPFIYDYAHNATPNPCIACNRFVRWDFLLSHALATGADYLATGHYARTIKATNLPIQLVRGVDAVKDQSYVLHVLTQHQLEHALFPLGEYNKKEVRLLAHKYKLPVADRPDSQDLCFIGSDGDYRRFLIRYAPQTQKPGLIVNQRGQALGNHNGLAFFTIGQRKGLQISSPSPLYVIKKDYLRNEIIVGPKEESGNDHLTADHANWIIGHPPDSSFPALVKIRYNAKEIPGVVTVINDRSFSIKFENPIAGITPGQAAVLYNGDTCLGGGMICDNMGNLVEN
jgi:tRNA-specific 2-thiouridylase